MAYLALYRQYRPMDFDSVVGQDYVIRILKNQICAGRVGHAYLFTGIRGTGKTSIAKIFARAINCPHNDKGNPCNVCDVCKNIEKSGIMDIIEIDAASNRGVDEIREIREKVKYPPTLGKYKVYIIDEVHMLTKEAFNALLKTLEEPPNHAVFLLATTEPDKLPATILSRCQRFDIRPISQEQIAQQIHYIIEDIGVQMDEDAVQFVAFRGENSMRDALSLLDQIIDLKPAGDLISYQDVLEFTGMADDVQLSNLLSAILERKPQAVLTQMHALSAKGKDARKIMGQLIAHLRQVIIVKMAPKNASEILGRPERSLSVLQEEGRQGSLMQLTKIMDALIAESAKMKYSNMASIILELVLVKLASDQIEENRPKEIREKEQSVITPKKVALKNQQPIEAPLSQEVASNVSDKQPQQETIKPEKSLEETKPVGHDSNEKTMAPSTPPSEAIDVNVLKDRLVFLAQKYRPILKSILEEISIIQNTDTDFTIVHYTSAQGHLLKMPKNQEFLKMALERATHKKCTVSIQKKEKDFDTMNDLEKTQLILNDLDVKIEEK